MIVEDVDFRGHFAEPGCRALQQFVELYTKSVEARGADPNIGPRLPGLLRSAGFGNVQMRLVHPAALSGGIITPHLRDHGRHRRSRRAGRVTTDGELRETIEELWAFARDPYTVLGGPRVFQAWARR